MKRREFLVTTALSAATALGPLRAQTPRPAASNRALARIGMMTLNFTTLLKTPHQPPNPNRTLDLFDLPAMYADEYGVHNIELQHYHMAATEPSYYRELRQRIDRAKSRTIQLVVEFGGLNISAPDHNFLPRQQAIDLTKVWIDRAAILDCPRIMVNQGQPTPENKAYAVDTLKAMVDYGRTKNVKVTMETRGGGGARAGGAAPAAGAASTAAGVGQAVAPAASAQVTAEPAQPAWMLLNAIAKDAGGYINIDLGGIGAANQEELHTALRALLPSSSGSMHVKQSNNWDLATALRFIESQGYTGFYSIEAPGHERTRAIYDTILATI